MITADASTVTPAEFLNMVLGPRECEEIRRVRFLMNSGRQAEGLALLDALNRIQRAFGHPEYVVPGVLELTECQPDPMKRRAA